MSIEEQCNQAARAAAHRRADQEKTRLDALLSRGEARKETGSVRERMLKIFQEEK